MEPGEFTFSYRGNLQDEKSTLSYAVGLLLGTQVGGTWTLNPTKKLFSKFYPLPTFLSKKSEGVRF